MAVPGDPRVPEATPVRAVTVYWRPGCFYCSRLLRTFRRAGVVVDLRNIWEDVEAREFVRGHNAGDETVPTVALGDDVRTNPDPGAFAEELRASHPELLGEPEPGWSLRALLFGGA